MTFFEIAYEGTPSWEIGRAQGVVIRLLESEAFGPPPSSILDVGCGTGEHALLLAAGGHAVTGIDLVPEAIRRAREKAAARDVAADFVVGDALRLRDLGRTFDVALDVGLFHALDERGAAPYAHSLASAVRPGGRALVVCWSDRNPFGYGPRRVSRREIRRTFTRLTGWRVVAIEPEWLETRLPGGRVEAWLARLERRAAPGGSRS